MELIRSGLTTTYYKKYEFDTPGSYNIDIPSNAECEVILVGGGGGGTYSYYVNYSIGSWSIASAGGSAGMITGTTVVPQGTYEVIVGEGGVRNACSVSYPTQPWNVYGGNGGDTSAFGNIAGGGLGGFSYTGAGDPRRTNGDGGTSTVVSDGLLGSPGTQGSTVSRYDSYGAGGDNAAGQSGYAKIIVSSTIEFPDYDYSINRNDYHAIRQLVRKYYKYGTALNGTIIGNLTNNEGVVSGFSSANYLLPPDNPIPNWSNSEMVVKFKTNSFSNMQPLFGSPNYVAADINKYPLLCIYNTKKLGLIIGSSSGLQGTSILQTDTWYWAKLVSNGYTDTKIYLSTDGINYNLEDSSTTRLTKTGGNIQVGSGYLWSSNVFYLDGSIDLAESYIKINNDIWWHGTLPVESTASDYDFYIDANTYNATKLINSIEVPYYIPTLRSNGTMGGTEFACDSANSYRTTWNFVSNGGGTAVRLSYLGDWVSWYYPNPIKITNIMIAFDSVTTGKEVTGKFQASNDNLTWIDLSSYTENDEVSDGVDISPVNPDFYNYYRITLNGTASTTRCTLLSIEQVYMKQI